MTDYTEELCAWADALGKVHLPRWEELPRLNLYMDQVLIYINDTLSFLVVQPKEPEKSKKDDRLLTAAMINNYVKQHLLPKPEKKRYERQHLALLVVYVMLKQVLPLSDIGKGIQLQLALCQGDIQKAYDMFCSQAETSLACVSRMVRRTPDADAVDTAMPQSILGISMATMSLATKLSAQKVLSLKAGGEAKEWTFAEKNE